ncbi:hypothetical protein tf_36 [Pseudomonas phage tf]|jgi:hypothetical protein|uniref:Uncharacterized protein n=1 Tax=Pseudomonas phage tf TaxID=1114179 RepID=I2FLQ7_9CAUD|nr:hypothetical protein tf_36 [Pseudomonas phage tf]CCE60791.1 hypothetical protein tf_36 [Pseudomonas phage tf]
MVTVYVLTGQGRFLAVSRDKKALEKFKMDYYMGGHDNLHIQELEV